MARLVLNKKAGEPPTDSVYIGRPSKWGNPFAIGQDGTRSQVIRKYEAWVRSQPTLIADIKRELRNRTLVCWCAPLPCHGEVLLKIAHEDDP